MLKTQHNFLKNKTTINCDGFVQKNCQVATCEKADTKIQLDPLIVVTVIKKSKDLRVSTKAVSLRCQQEYYPRIW